MLVVSDTTPLNYLILIGVQDVLAALYGSVLVPTQVIEELTRPRAPALVQAWASKPPVWLQVKEGDASLYPLLDLGEAAALALAVESHADALLADDAEARLMAKTVGIVAIGTLGVLAEAHNASLLDFDTAIEALRTTSFHVHDSVIAAVKNRLQFIEDGG